MTDAQALIARLKAERAERLAKAMNASSELKQRLSTQEKPQPPDDPWQATLTAVEHMPTAPGRIERLGGEIRVRSQFLLDGVLDFDRSQVRVNDSRRLAGVMQRLGWVGPKDFRMGTKIVKGYVKKTATSTTTTPSSSNVLNAQYTATSATPATHEQRRSLRENTDQQRAIDGRQPWETEDGQHRDD